MSSVLEVSLVWYKRLTLYFFKYKNCYSYYHLAYHITVKNKNDSLIFFPLTVT